MTHPLDYRRSRDASTPNHEHTTVPKHEHEEVPSHTHKHDHDYSGLASAEHSHGDLARADRVDSIVVALNNLASRLGVAEVLITSLLNHKHDEAPPHEHEHEHPAYAGTEHQHGIYVTHGHLGERERELKAQQEQVAFDLGESIAKLVDHEHPFIEHGHQDLVDYVANTRSSNGSLFDEITRRIQSVESRSKTDRAELNGVRAEVQSHEHSALEHSHEMPEHTHEMPEHAHSTLDHAHAWVEKERKRRTGGATLVVYACSVSGCTASKAEPEPPNA